MHEVTKVRRVEHVERLPDSDYSGTWGGYLVRFSIDGSDYEASAAVGIRTPCAPCRVVVKDGQVSVEVVT